MSSRTLKKPTKWRYTEGNFLVRLLIWCHLQVIPYQCQYWADDAVSSSSMIQLKSHNFYFAIANRDASQGQRQGRLISHYERLLPIPTLLAFLLSSELLKNGDLVLGFRAALQFCLFNFFITKTNMVHSKDGGLKHRYYKKE